jgi:hypothetical protein
VRVEALRICVAYRDLEVSTRVGARILDRGLAECSVAEVRAWVIAYARLAPTQAEPLLAELALGARAGVHPELQRLALHGLRALGTATARSTIERVQLTLPDFAEEARAMLAQGTGASS